METSGGDLGLAVAAKRARPSSDDVGGGEEYRISALPDDILVLLRLRTAEAARTFTEDASAHLHHGDGSRDTFTAAALDGWLRSPALDGLKEIELRFNEGSLRWGAAPPPLPPSARRFSSTLVAARFGACVFFPDGLQHHYPLLKKLTLSKVTVSESSLDAMLAGCPVLESLLLRNNQGATRVRIASPSLRSIGVGSSWQWMPQLRELVVEDAPRLERLLILEADDMGISVISAPRLGILGEIHANGHMLQFGTIPLQGSTIASMTAVVPSVRVLALTEAEPCFDAVINLIKCFPRLEVLYIETTRGILASCNNTQWKLTIVLGNYQNYSEMHISLAKFFVINASKLESMTLVLRHRDVGNKAWLRAQRMLLEVEKVLRGVHGLILYLVVSHLVLCMRISKCMICQY